ncbi:MAG: hypothetical protein AAF968_16005 [Pseudomonadota bacterium]
MEPHHLTADTDFIGVEPGQADVLPRARPRRLVTAARHCAQAMLRTGRGPRLGEEEECALVEAACEQTRQRRPLAYSNRRHVEALARLLAAEARAAAAAAPQA